VSAPSIDADAAGVAECISTAKALLANLSPDGRADHSATEIRELVADEALTIGQRALLLYLAATRDGEVTAENAEPKLLEVFKSCATPYRDRGGDLRAYVTLLSDCDELITEAMMPHEHPCGEGV
jgi:hypothetical protein